MKKFTFFAIFTLAVMISWGQGIRQYDFQYTLAEKKGHTPTLIMLDSAGTFVLDTLNEINHKTKIVYRFKKGSGLQFNNTLSGNFIGQTYSIEIYFVFDQLGSWKRVIDWKNRTTDHGAYIYNGNLDFYPYIETDSAFVIAGEYTYYVLTRDSASMQMKIYTDTKLGITYTDINGDAVLDTANVLNFFQDDLQVQNETSSGAIALLNIYNYVLDSNAIKTNFTNLQGQIFSVNNMKNQGTIRVYPNPATNNLVIDLNPLRSQGMVRVNILDLTGTVVYSNRFDAGRLINLDLNTPEFTSGIYLIKAETDSGVYTKKIVLVR